MQALYAISLIFIAFCVIGINGSLRRLVAHHLKFTAPGGANIEVGQVIYLEPFMKVVRVLEVGERPTGMVAVKIEPFEGTEHTFVSDAL